LKNYINTKQYTNNTSNKKRGGGITTKSVNTKIEEYKKNLNLFVNRINRTFFEDYKRPKTNISQNTKGITINIELPEIDKKNIHLHIDESKVDIYANKKIKRIKKRRDIIETKISFKGFHRTITLPTGIDINKADAQWKNNNLSIKMPFKKIKKIQIR